MESTDFMAPDDVLTVCDQMEQFAGIAHLLAGGTDLMVAVNLKRLFPEKLIYLGHCGLDRIERAGENLVIGAAATLTSVIGSEAVKKSAPLLVEACGSIGSPAVRNAATLGGNICNASPAADGAVALLALGAEVVAVSRRGERTVALKDFFTGPGRTVLQPNELVKEFRIPVHQRNTRCGWSKIGQRKAEIIGIASAAICLQLEDGKCSDARIALGAVAPTPLLTSKTSGMLEGMALEGKLIGEVARATAEETAPIDDIRASAWYRKQVVAEMVQRILETIAKENADGRS